MKNVEQRIEALLKWMESSPSPATDLNSRVVSRKLEVKDNKVSGRGLYSKEDIKPGERIINIPRSFLLNHTTVVKHILKHKATNHMQSDGPQHHSLDANKPGSEDYIAVFYSGIPIETLERLSSFQLISMYLVLESVRRDGSFWDPFIAMLPELSELSPAPIVSRVLDKESSSSMWSFLPRSARKHSEKVVARYEKDYEVVCKIWSSHGIMQNLTESVDLQRSFLWAWMCINSRCLYMDIPGREGADNFTMAPYVDFLNHTSDEECGIKIDAAGFHVYTTTAYEAEDELFFSYGPHSNEFLLCEYGFVLPQNKWNYLDVTDLINPLLRPAHVRYLKNHAYYGDYTVNQDGMSFRTEIAFATMQESAPESSTRLNDFIGGISDGREYTRASNLLLSRILQKILSDCKSKLDRPSERGYRSVRQLYEDMMHICKAVLPECQNDAEY